MTSVECICRYVRLCVDESACVRAGRVQNQVSFPFHTSLFETVLLTAPGARQFGWTAGQQAQAASHLKLLSAEVVSAWQAFSGGQGSVCGPRCLTGST